MWICEKVQRKRGIGGGLVFLISALSLWGEQVSSPVSVFPKADRPKVQLFIQNVDTTREQLRHGAEELFASYERHRNKGAILAALLHEKLLEKVSPEAGVLSSNSDELVKNDAAFLKKMRYANEVYPLGLEGSDISLLDEGMRQELYRSRTLQMDAARQGSSSTSTTGDAKTLVVPTRLEERLGQEGIAFSRYLKPRIAKVSKSALIPFAELLENRFLSHPETPPLAFKRLREEAQKLKGPQYQEWILSLCGTSPRFLASFSYSWGKVTGPEIESFKKAYREFQGIYEKALVFQNILSAACGLVWLIDEYEGFRGPDGRFLEDTMHALEQISSLSPEEIDILLQEYPSYRRAFLELASSLWLFLFRPMPLWLLEKLGDVSAVSKFRSWLFRVACYTPQVVQEEQKKALVPNDYSLPVSRGDIEILERSALAVVRAEDDISRLEAVVPLLSQKKKVLEYFMSGKGRTEEGKLLYQSMQRLLDSESPPLGLINSSATIVLFVGDLLTGKPLGGELLALLYRQSGKGNVNMVLPYESYGFSLIQDLCHQYGIPENLLMVGKGTGTSFPWSEAVGALSLSGFRLGTSFRLARRGRL
ncbi:MAG: hypothetical protein N2Z76_03930 [Treponemataceae bacterium]|nr:hypothetical protein [Treponemataceae bacterium]